MNITGIKESGSNNLLLWAIKNGADLYNESQLRSLINDELFYQITLTDVNYLELFRLTQMYREKLRIITQKPSSIPTEAELSNYFKGEIELKGETGSTHMPITEAVTYCCQSFINIVQQMTNDDDIISTGALSLFLPMLTRRYDVQIPIAFHDVISSLTEEESKKFFSVDYPNNIETLLDKTQYAFITQFSLVFIKGTSIIRRSEKYDKYLKVIKYNPLLADKSNKLYKVALLGFHKYDNVSRGEVRCSLFEMNKALLPASLKRLNKLSTPLQVDFAVELPIQYMQMLLNSFEPEMLTVSYESSMATIIGGGLEFNDFIMPEESDTESDVYKERLNQIEAYKIRLAESNQITMNTISAILGSNDTKIDVDETATFALLPSIYRTKAVITLNLNYEDKYRTINDTVLAELFDKMLNIASDIVADINSAE